MAVVAEPELSKAFEVGAAYPVAAMPNALPPPAVIRIVGFSYVYPAFDIDQYIVIR